MLMKITRKLVLIPLYFFHRFLFVIISRFPSLISLSLFPFPFSEFSFW